MKKAFLSVFMALAITFSFSSVTAMAADESTVAPDTPSELFIDLYSKVFLHTETYEVYDKNGVCITDTFVSEFYDDFLNSDFLTMWNAVAENGYLLKYDEPQSVPNGASLSASEAMKTAASEWTYVLEELDDLLPGKMVEFLYRVTGEYWTDGSAITRWNAPELELNMTFPGSLFTYTTSTTDTVSYNAAHTEVYFGVSFTIEFCYPYSDTPYQELGAYTATAVGTA